MNEKELEKLFLAFLIERKNYSSKGILTQIPIVAGSGMRFQPDLLLLDTSIGEYIGMVEFKNSISPQIKETAKKQVKLYLTGIKSDDIPAFLVYPINENDFNILVLSDKSEWEPIAKDDFPEFDSLSAKKQTEKKQRQKEIEEDILVEFELKKRKYLLTSVWTLTSLIIGVLASFIAIYISQDNFKKTKLDADKSYKSEINTIQSKIQEIEKKILLHDTTIDTIIYVDSSKTALGIENRLKTIENAIISNPEKIITIFEINQQIDNLNTYLNHIEEIEEIRIESLNTRLDFLNSWVLGIVIALFSAAIGFVFTNFIKKNNTAANTRYQ